MERNGKIVGFKDTFVTFVLNLKMKKMKYDGTLFQVEKTYITQ